MTNKPICDGCTSLDTSLKDFNTIDVALALAEGTPQEKIVGTIKRLGGNPADYGL